MPRNRAVVLVAAVPAVALAFELELGPERGPGLALVRELVLEPELALEPVPELVPEPELALVPGLEPELVPPAAVALVVLVARNCSWPTELVPWQPQHGRAELGPIAKAEHSD